MDSEKAKTIASFLMDELESEMQTTLRVIGAVPIDHLDYRPDKVSRSGLGLIRHIVLEDEWLLNCTAGGAFVPPPDDSNACGIMTPEDGIRRYKERLPAAIQRARGIPPERLCEEIDFMGIMKKPGIAFLSITVKHSVHHRGQLSAYLRAMGGKVPGIYGPSGDK